MSAIQLPDFLNGVAAATEFYNRAGEWDLEMTDDIVVNDAAYLFHAKHILPASQSFLQSFTWFTPTSARLIHRSHDHYTEHIWSLGDEMFTKWLDSVVLSNTWVSEFEINCRAFISFVDPNGTQGNAFFPNFARWKLYCESTLLTTLTIWPNLFTNLIPIYPDNWTGWTKGKAHPFQPAATENRTKLATTLHLWEQLSGGTITNWESELVDGVEQYGFRDDAKPY